MRVQCVGGPMDGRWYELDGGREVRFMRPLPGEELASADIIAPARSIHVEYDTYHLEERSFPDGRPIFLLIHEGMTPNAVQHYLESRYASGNSAWVHPLGTTRHDAIEVPSFPEMAQHVANMMEARLLETMRELYCIDEARVESWRHSIERASANFSNGDVVLDDGNPAFPGGYDPGDWRGFHASATVLPEGTPTDATQEPAYAEDVFGEEFDADQSFLVLGQIAKKMQGKGGDDD